MRRLRGTTVGILAALVSITAFTPALADVRLFTFPDGSISIVRRFVEKIVMEDTGPAPLAQILLPTTYPIGTQFRVQGNLAAIGGLGGTVTIYESAGTNGFSLTAAGTFNQTITLTAATDRLNILGASYTSAEFTSLTVDEVI